MSSPATKRPRWRRIFIFCLGAGLALCVAIFMWRKSLIETALIRAAASLGQQLSLDSLETDLWTSIELRGVALHSDELEANQLHVQAEVIRIKFSLNELLRGELSGLQAVSAQGLEGDVQLASSMEPASAGSSELNLPASLPLIDVSIERLGLHLPGIDPIQIQKLSLATNPASPEDIELTVARVLYEDRAASVRGNFRYAAGRVVLDALEVGDAATLTGFLEHSASEVQWNLDLALGTGHLTTSGRQSASERRVELQCNSLSLRELASFGREALVEDATGVLHASLHAQDDGASLFPAFDGELELLRLQASGYEVEHLFASLHTEEAGEVSWEELKGQALLEATGLHLPGAQLDDLDADLRFDGTRFTLANLSSVGALHELVARGEVILAPTQIDISLDELTLKHDVTDLVLISPTRLTLTDGIPTQLTIFELEGTAGRALIRFDPATPGCVELRVEDLTSNGLLAAISKGLPEVEGVAGNVKACRSLQGWAGIAADLTVRRLRFDVAEFDCSARLRGEWADDRLELQELALTKREVTLLEARGSVGINESGLIRSAPLEMSLETRISQVREHLPEKWRADWPADADLNLDLTLTGTPADPTGQLIGALENFTLLGKSNPSQVFLPPTELSIAASLGEALVLEELTWAGAESHHVRANATLELPAGKVGNSQTFMERLRDGRLRGSGTVMTENLDGIGDWLRDWFDFSSNLRGGQIAGEFQVTGTLASPQVNADFNLARGTLRTGGLPPINKLKAKGHLENDRLELRAISGELGASPFTAEASIDLTTASPTVSASLRGDELLLVRNSSARVRADLDLNLTGPLDALLLSGTITLAQGRLVSPLEILDFNLRGQKPSRREGLFLFRISEAPLKNMRFDLALRSRGSFEIDNNVARGSVRPDLHLSGTGEVPTLAGTLYIDKTLVKLPASNVTVRSGSLRFEETDPFFPRIEVSANARIKGYEVLITIVGPYDRPEVFLSSTPPLPDEDLILLVLAGQLPGASASRTGRAAAQSVAVYLAKDYLTRWLSDADPEDESSWFDRFDFQTGRDISRSGAETLEASFRIDEDRFLEGDTLYLTAESDQYDFVNFGLRLVFRFR